MKGPMVKERVRVGVMGAGFISEYHIVGLQEAGADVVAIFSRTESKARKKAQRFGIPYYSTDYQEILARDDVEAVVIATPDFTHEEMSRVAARAGKAILLQKPMARTSQECLRIIEVAEEARVPLYVSFMHRYFEEVECTRDMLAHRALGEVYEIRQRNATPGADWEAWFYSKAMVGGGVVLQLGTHGIDLLRQLFGEIEAVKAATAIVGKARTLADGAIVTPDNDDLAVAIYRLASGAMVVHEMSCIEVAGTDRFRMEIYGGEGTAWLRTERGRLAVYAPAYFGREVWVAPELPEPNFRRRQHHHFLAMLRGEEPPDSSAHDGLVSLLVAEAIYRSSASGDWEKVHWP